MRNVIDTTISEISENIHTIFKRQGSHIHMVIDRVLFVKQLSYCIEV